MIIFFVFIVKLIWVNPSYFIDGFALTWKVTFFI